MIEFLINDMFLSLLRWAIGLAIGTFAGLLLAIIGQTRLLKNRPHIFILDFLRAVPIIGLVPVIQMNIGVNEYGKIGLIAWGVMFPIWLTIRRAFTKIMPDAKLMLQATNITRFRYYRVYVGPKVLAGAIQGIEIAIGIAWLCVVAAEWIGTYSQGFWSGGLGYRLIWAYQQNDWFTVHFVLLIFGVFGIATAWLWRASIRFVFRKCNGFNPLKLRLVG